MNFHNASETEAVLDRPVVIYFDGAFVNRGDGSQIRVAELLTFFLTIAPRVIVYGYRNHPWWSPWDPDGIARFAAEFPTVELVLDNFSLPLRILSRLKLLGSMLAPTRLNTILRIKLPFSTPGLLKIRETLVDPIHIIVHARALLTLNGVPKEDFIVETHDIAFLHSMKLQNRQPTDLRVMLWARSEMGLLKYARNITSLSQSETYFFRAFLQYENIFFIPRYGSASESENAVVEWGKYGPFLYDLLFVGSGHLMNSRGVVEFMKRHNDWLKGRTFAIAGRVCESREVMSAAADVGATLLGYVDDIDQLYQASRLVVSPVEGSGLKIKVVQALAAGKPIFASANTLDGLPSGFETCVFPIDEEAMDDLIFDSVKRENIGRQSLQYSKVIMESEGLRKFRKFLLSTK